MPSRQKGIAVNAPPALKTNESKFREHLVSASDQFYFYELLCEQYGREVSEGVKQAHALVRAELEK